MRTFLLGLLLLALAVAVQGSSHGEAPGTSVNPQTDVTDVLAFRSYESGRSNYVTLIANWNPRQTAYGGPNFYPLSDQFYYEIYVDQNGNGIPDITYQFVFHNELASNGTGIALNVGGRTQPIALKAIGPVSAGNNANLNFLEFYRLNVVTSAGSQPAVVSTTSQNFFVKPSDNFGQKTFPNYTAYAAQYYYNVDFPGCSTPGKVFVGQRAESFHVNLGPIFDLVNLVPIDGASGFPGGINQSDANNDLQYANIVSTILEVPISCITASTSAPVIGVWAASRSIRGNRQKSRLGNPLVNELLIGLKDKDKFSRRVPTADRNLLNYIYYPTFPAILDALFRTAVNSVLKTSFSTIAPTNFPRRDLTAVFLTGVPGLNYLQDTPTRYVEMIRLNTSVAATPAGNQSSLGVLGNDLAGYPNGRRPGDDVVDIVLRAAMGVLCHANLGVCSPSQAVVGTVPFTDGAPVSSTYFSSTWPYLTSPVPGNVQN